MFKGHPRGLPVLFFTEMWERFGFYLMLGIFYLYMTDTARGGLGFDNVKATDIVGTYLALVYLTPFLGGLLADRILGYRKSIIIGGVLMGTGYLMMSIPGEAALWPALFLIIFGNGFFKPNISTLVGNLYAKKEFAANKDAGYNIFYMGINIGAFICNFVAAYLRNNFGWGYAFAAAGIGMFLGVVWFLSGQQHTKEADIIKPTNPEDVSLGKITLTVFGPLVLFGILGFFLPTILFGDTLFGSKSNDAFILGSIPVAVFYISLWVRANKKDKEPIAALLSIFAVVIIFWAIFHQNGTALTLWARDYTARSLPAVVEVPAGAMGMVEQVTTEQEQVPKLDRHGNPLTDESGKVITEMGYHTYLRNLDQSQWPAEDSSLKLLSTEIFQSINPFFVVILTPLVVAFFAFLRRRRKEPSTPAKIGWGLFITAVSMFVMMGAVLASQNGLEKSSPIWLITMYGVITVGELFLSPMGLSLVSKLSPTRITSLMMGGWFVATSIGNKLSGAIAGLWGAFDNKIYFFMVNFGGAFGAALVIFLMVKWLRRIVEEHAEEHLQE
jgi:POT family proton-dependent oligopeptide transporter